MEVNQEQSERCAEIATKCLREGDFSKALRMARKSNNLYPNETAKRIIEAASKYEKENEGAGKREETNESQQRKRKPHTEQSAQAPREYTPEQHEIVKSILIEVKGEYNYYKILGLDKKATAKDIKLSYRKLALKVHPDKNGAPGADEAFKAVNEAFDTLSDVNKRSTYDLCGRTSRTRRINETSHNHARYREPTPEEIFEMFFGGRGFGPGVRGNTYYYRRPSSNSQEARNSNANRTFNGNSNHSDPFVDLWRIIPFFLLTLFAAFFMMSSSPKYSLTRSMATPVERKTEYPGISYYVSDSYDHELNQMEVNKLRNWEESNIVENWIFSINNQCQVAKAQIAYAKKFGRYRESENPLPSICYQLERVLEQRKNRSL